ncbi:MAG TPA: hypothetical protein VFW98_17650 [Gemmatimonadaceae bacterium]|nr:hypothetical protein [Gemmatimonadaceae bacterium]
MFSTCIVCYSTLGANETIEHFPVGRRLAFDAERGRLWVVCPRCGRWNLSPLEERWEAIEECERRFRGTVLRHSTAHIGLARLPDGVDLIRVGRPLRPEMAAWRYGRRFAGRFRRAQLTLGAAGVGGGAAILSGLAVGVLTPGLMAGAALTASAGWWLRQQRVLFRVPFRGQVLRVRARDLSETQFVPIERGDQWSLRLAHRDGASHLEGEEAVRVMARALAPMNGGGAGASTVEQAVARLEVFGDRARMFAFMARTPGYMATPQHLGVLAKLPAAQRLALEMMVQEDSEERALSGELAALEEAWREAEEVAGIADDLLVPEAVTSWVARHRRRADGDV